MYNNIGHWYDNHSTGACERGQPSRTPKCPKSYLNISRICYTEQKTTIFILEIVGATTIITNIIIKRLVKTCFGTPSHDVMSDG